MDRYDIEKSFFQVREKYQTRKPEKVKSNGLFYFIRPGDGCYKVLPPTNFKLVENNGFTYHDSRDDKDCKWIFVEDGSCYNGQLVRHVDGSYSSFG